MKNNSAALKLTITGAATAVALILSYIESLIPLSFAVPGVKLGLANIVSLFVLYRLDWRFASLVSLLRVLLAALLFGSAMTLAYSASGAALSLALMILLKKSAGFSAVGVSCAGAVAHNIGQIAMAAILTETAQIAYYLPVLIISGVITGLAIGAAGAVIIQRIKLNIGKRKD